MPKSPAYIVGRLFESRLGGDAIRQILEASKRTPQLKRMNAKRGPTYVKGIHKGNFFRIQLPSKGRKIPNIPELPPSQPYPKAPKAIAEQQTKVSTGAIIEGAYAGYYSDFLQQFQQQVIQKYGWWANYDTDDNGCWFVDVIVGFNAERYRFQSTLRDQKKGKEAVSALAVKTLAEHVAKEEGKPAQHLDQVFKDPIQIYDSKKDGTWDMFWQNKPSVVGLDVEGNQISPPVLVQISTDEYTILEVPQRGLSSNLERLLDDNSIVKVFCDNFSNKDKMCLGLHFLEETDFTKPPIVDIEVLFGSISGNVKVPRGLSKLVSMCMPELNVRVAKPSQKRSKLSNIGRFAMIEQGKALPLHSLQELSEKEKQYAALDAWCTLQVYRRIQQEIMAS
eukprot:scaffold1580_cov116-Cylindrotheca_fusiformis.AAC.25